MKKFFNKLKNYNFWVSFSAALVILLNAFGNAFGFSIQNQIVEDCVMAIAGMLVVFGIVNMKNSGDDENKTDEKNDNADENDEDDSSQYNE